MRPANMEWHKLWWEWSRQRSHAVGIGEGMIRSIQAKGWGGCCSQRSWTCHSNGWTPPSGFWDYCGLGNILIRGLLMYVRLWNTLKDIWSILYNIMFWDSLDFVMWIFRVCVVVVCIEMIRNKSYNIAFWNIISSRLCNVVYQASSLHLHSQKNKK